MAVEIIGITGGIGSGKSVVSRILRCCGFTVYDCDSEAKKLMTCNYMVKDCLINLFGDSVYHPSGELNKTLIADKLFSDNDIRVQVNAIVHRAVRNDIKKTADEFTGIFFIESAIIATAKLDNVCDRVWIVTAPEKLRIERVGRRDSISESDIRRRIEVQHKEFENIPKEKIEYIENDLSSSLLRRIFQLLGFWNPQLIEVEIETINNKIDKLC